jgi:hypothetical protein
MSRDLDAALEAALSPALIRPVMFYEAEFVGGAMVRLWSGAYNRSWNGHTWEGIGSIVGIGKVEETQTLRAAAVEIVVQGITSDSVSRALQSLAQNRPGRIYMGLLDDSDVLIGDPTLAFEGRLDSAQINEKPDGAVVVMRYESRLIDLERPRIRRFTHEDQQVTSPGDRGFEFIPALQDVTISWGNTNSPASPPLTGMYFVDAAKTLTGG